MTEHALSRRPAFRSKLLTAITTVTVLTASLLLAPTSAYAAPTEALSADPTATSTSAQAVEVEMRTTAPDNETPTSIPTHGADDLPTSTPISAPTATPAETPTPVPAPRHTQEPTSTPTPTPTPTRAEDNARVTPTPATPEATASSGKSVGIAEASARISGTVLGGAAGTTPLSNIRVIAWQENGGWSATTDAAGKYEIIGLDAGSYTVEFSSNDGLHRSEYWDNQPTSETATSFVLTETGQRTGVNAVLAPAAVVSGRVTSSAGTGLDGITVVIYDADQNWVGYSYTDATGAYSVGNLTPGQRTIAFMDYDGNYLNEVWDNKPSFETATMFTLTAGQKLTGRNASLATAATISGVITDDTTGKPVPNISVRALSGDDSPGSADTDENGRYTIGGLPAGSYTLNVYSDTHQTEWWNNRTLQQDADSIAVSAGQKLTGKNIGVALAGSLTGTVTDSAGAPIQSQFVSVLNAAGEEYLYSWTDSDGVYMITGVAPGKYRVQFGQNSSGEEFLSEWWDNKSSLAAATVLTVVGGKASTADAQLTRGGTISGTVTGTAGAALSDIYVSAYSTDSEWQGGTSTDEKGSYTLVGLTSGNYTLQFFDNGQLNRGYLSEWWNDKPTREAADVIAVVAGKDSTGKNVSLATGGEITGKVTADATGLPVAGVQVSASSSDNGSGYVRTETDSSGNYTLTGLSADSYSVYFSSQSDVLMSEWWDNKTESWSSDPVQATPGSTTSGINAQLAAAGVITGTVSDKAGAAVADLEVTVYSANGSSVANGTTGSNGKYSVGGLPTGSYRVGFGTSNIGDSAFIARWWKDAATFETATAVSVVAGKSIAGINATLTQGASISGTILHAGAGEDIPTGYAYIYSSDKNWLGSTRTGTGGEFTIGGLPQGVYYVEFGTSLSSYAGQWWKNANSRSDATPITVAASAAVTGISATLEIAGSISGTVSGVKETDDPYRPTVTAWVKTASGYVPVTAWTIREDWTYTVPGLRPGSYKMVVSEFHSPTTTYPESWWKNAADMASATDVVLASGSDLDAIDFTMVDESTLLTLPTPPVPKIAGTAKVGQKLTGSTAAWKPTGVSLSYTWSRNGTSISGATALTYTLTPEDAGTKVTFSVSGTKTGYHSATATSAETATVTGGVLTGVVPTFTGTAKIGKTLTATNGTWEPAPVTVTHQWLRNGSPISGATGKTYVVVAADATKSISVKATGTKPGFTTTSFTSTAVTIEGVMTTMPTPTISGSAVVGGKLTAKPGTWSPATATLSYQWSRDGVILASATKTSYTLLADDVGAKFTVTVTGTLAGYATVPRTSAATAAVVPATMIGFAPTISGTATVGKTLTATVAAWSPAPVAISYQWKRGGTAIKSATASTYTLVAADAAKAITVTVTGTKAGYSTLAKTSGSKTVTSILTATPTPTISGTAVLGGTLTAKAGTWTPSPVALAYQWKREGVVIPKATASTYKLVSADTGKKITVAVTGKKSGYVSVTKTSTATTVAKVLTATPTPKITGTAKIGQTLKVTAGTWSPAPVTLKYTWLRGGTAISGATSSSYKLVAADKGKMITVKVTGSKSGYATISKSTTAVKPG
ncbi:MAG: hypothetical protein JWQ43_793 [Glaciihabitans sp.]|nr:hypothetical protein [Glaciihabitans sp.]